MAETTSDIAAGLSAATSGTDTPNQMTVARPAKEAIWAVFLAMWSAMGLTMLVLGIIGTGLWRGYWPDANKADIIKSLLWIALGALGCMFTLTVALASSRLGQVKASAGPINVDIEGKG